MLVHFMFGDNERRCEGLDHFFPAPHFFSFRFVLFDFHSFVFFQLSGSSSFRLSSSSRFSFDCSGLGPLGCGGSSFRLSSSSEFSLVFDPVDPFFCCQQPVVFTPRMMASPWSPYSCVGLRAFRFTFSFQDFHRAAHYLTISMSPIFPVSSLCSVFKFSFRFSSRLDLQFSHHGFGFVMLLIVLYFEFVAYSEFICPVQVLHILM